MPLESEVRARKLAEQHKRNEYEELKKTSEKPSANQIVKNVRNIDCQAVEDLNTAFNAWIGSSNYLDVNHFERVRVSGKIFRLHLKCEEDPKQVANLPITCAEIPVLRKVIASSLFHDKPTIQGIDGKARKLELKCEKELYEEEE